MKTSGFTPTNFQLKPPYISFALVLIGLGFTGLAIVFYFMGRDIELGWLPPVTLYIGLVLFLSSIAYLWNRKRKTAEAKRADEIKFKKWAKTAYNIELNNDQVEQLFYYGSTLVDNSKWVLHYDLVDGEAVGHLYSAAQWQEAVNTEIINTIDGDANFFQNKDSELEYLDDEESEEETEEPEIISEETVKPSSDYVGEATVPDYTATEPIKTEPKLITAADIPEEKNINYTSSSTLAELKAAAKNVGIKNYSRMSKSQLLEALNK